MQNACFEGLGTRVTGSVVGIKLVLPDHEQSSQICELFDLDMSFS